MKDGVKYPHITNQPFDNYAFNALAVMDIIAGFHAGNQVIFVKKENIPLVKGSSAYESLVGNGWTFLEMPDCLKRI